MDQRDGRARRAGAGHSAVDVVRFEPPPMVEARLRQLACLAGKRLLPAAAGLDETARGLWRWRADLAERFQHHPTAEGVASLPIAPAGLLAGFALHAWPAAGAPLASYVLWWDAESGWTEDPDTIAARLEAARAQAAGGAWPVGVASAIDAALLRLADPIRRHMSELRQSRWLGAHASPSAHRVVARLQTLARGKARRRDGEGLDRLYRAIRFAAGGHTAGEAAWLAQLAAMPDAALESALASVPPPPTDWDALQARVTGLVLFVPS
jgi:hypothetical protein